MRLGSGKISPTFTSLLVIELSPETDSVRGGTLLVIRHDLSEVDKDFFIGLMMRRGTKAFLFLLLLDLGPAKRRNL
jgi:hypothetical protein